jgi:hypothetical protein
MFEGWDSFYLLVGSASGALIGLLFVVVTLTTNLDRSTASRGTSLYMSPTVFHFAMIVVVSAVGVAPRVGAQAAGAVIGGCALLGLTYATVVGARLRLGRAPEPAHWSDFWCYGVAPAAIYLGLLASAASIWTAPDFAPDWIAVTLVVLLLTCIRNAWDLVTYLAPRASDPPAG